MVLAGQPGTLLWLLDVALVPPVVAPIRREVVLWVCPGALYADADVGTAVVAHEVRLGMVWYRTIHSGNACIVLYPSVWVPVHLDL